MDDKQFGFKFLTASKALDPGKMLEAQENRIVSIKIFLVLPVNIWLSFIIFVLVIANS